MHNKADETAAYLEKLVPRQAGKWKAEIPGDVYGPETIFDYIDGAGEVYRSYNFKRLLAVRYAKSGGPDIVADIFDMGSSEDAFGVFTHDVEGRKAGIVNDSTYKGGLLSFWKDRFFVSVYAEGETEEAEKAVLELGKKIAASIPQTGERPKILSLLPDPFEREKSRHYFHTHLILNYHFYVAEENILDLDNKTECLLSVREKSGSLYILLLVRYGDRDRARRAFERFLESCLPDADEQNAARTEDGLWTAARNKGPYLMIIFNSPEQKFGLDVLDRWEKMLPREKKDHEPVV
ncbi:MAG: hypothetical protein JXB26_19235 [Candidatus Aminicenantes bacterium]|nr:hypothetical protein [Candidatus Aminicenantes bacterium]